MVRADWSNVPIELLSMIGYRLDVGADRIRFRSVCQSYRSSFPFPCPPWLVLSESDQCGGIVPYDCTIDDDYDDDEEEKEDDNDEEEVEEEEQEQEQEEEKGQNVNDELMAVEKEVNTTPTSTSIPLRGIVDIGKQQIYELKLPEAYRKRFIGSTGTWLMTVDINRTIHLLNPFSRVQFKLPSLPPFAFSGKWASKYHRDDCIVKAIISAPPASSSSSTGDFVAMAIYYSGGRIAMARPGDASWVDIRSFCHGLRDMIFYKNQFYVVNGAGKFMVCDIGSDLHSSTASILVDNFQFEKFGIDLKLEQKLYLVEWMGELLLVIRLLDVTEYRKYVKEGKTYENSEDKPWYRTTEFKVYKLDFANKKWGELKSLGDYSLFLGMNTSVSILASVYNGRVKENCIYFTDDCIYFCWKNSPAGHDMGIFDMENNIIQPHYHGISTSRFSPPIWLIPTA